MFGYHKDYFSRKYRRRTHCMTLLCYMTLMSAFRYGEDIGTNDFTQTQDFRYREYRPFAPYTETIGPDAIKVTWLPVSRRENLNGYYELYNGNELEYNGQDLIHIAKRLHSETEYVFKLRVCSYFAGDCSAFSRPRYQVIRRGDQTRTVKMYLSRVPWQSYAFMLFLISSIVFAGCLMRYIVSFFNEIAVTIEAIPNTIYQSKLDIKHVTHTLNSSGKIFVEVPENTSQKTISKKTIEKESTTESNSSGKDDKSVQKLTSLGINPSNEPETENSVKSCETDLVEKQRKKTRRVRSKTVSLSKLAEPSTNLSMKLEKCHSDSEIYKQRSKSTVTCSYVEKPLFSTAETSGIVVVVDNSNIFIGAKATVSMANPDIRPRHVKLRINQLLHLIEDGRKVTRAMIGGSSPSTTSEHVWDVYRRAGYKVDIEERRGKDEQRVDEHLHLAIYKALIELPPQILVIASGDGHKGKSKFSTSFVQCAKRAIEHGWKVEVLSWKHCLSSEWLRLAATSDRISVRYLDIHLAKLTVIEKKQ